MPFLMSFALEHEIVTFAWIDNASVQFPLNIYATKGYTLDTGTFWLAECLRTDAPETDQNDSHTTTA